MKFEAYRNLLARQIIFSNLLLFVIILIFYILKGFTDDELKELFKYLLPAKALYLTAVIKFSIAQQNKPESVERAFPKIQPLYQMLARYFIYTHISLLYSIVLLSAFNVIAFETAINLLIGIEVFFGIYTGLIINDLFSINEK